MKKSQENGLVIETSDQPAKAAGQYISDLLATNSDKPILLLLAGGSSFDVLDFINPEYLTEQITVTVTDERFTDDIFENNFDNLQGTHFYNNCIDAGVFCINTSILSGDLLEDHRARFEKNIKDWINEFPKGIIIGLYGIGPDGHTAGIIPGIYTGKDFDEKFNGSQMVTSVEDSTGKSKFSERVTTTISFMKNLDYPVFYATGEAKREVLTNALNPESKLEDVPARIIVDLPNPVLFTDLSL